METTATILHADLDAFYASVEQLLDPSLRGKPIAVGGGVVLAASYEAKAFGIHSGMPGRRARDLCPQLIFVGGHFEDYQRLGDAAMKVLEDFTPLVERISIDEAFADVAGCTHLFGSPAEIAGAIRRRVQAELGLPISVGVARTKHLAKIASQVPPDDGRRSTRRIDFLHAPVELVWAWARLPRHGYEIYAHHGQLAQTPRSFERLLVARVREAVAPRGIVIRAKSRTIGGRGRPARSQRSEEARARGLHHAALSADRLPAGCVPNPGLVDCDSRVRLRTFARDPPITLTRRFSDRILPKSRKS